jgi:hypothetical protein
MSTPIAAARPGVVPKLEPSNAFADLVAERVAARLAVPRLTLTVQEACSALGVSWDFWAEYVAPDVRVVRKGRRKLVPVSELERWVADHAELALDRSDLDAAEGRVAVGAFRASRQPRASARAAA